MKSGDSFAPAEKADPQAVLQDAMQLASNRLIDHLTNTLPCVVMILNRQRQIIYKNRRLTELLGNPPDQDVIGKRPGELLNCIHAKRNDNECGTTEFCRECGAAQSILTSQYSQVVSVKECRITTTAGSVYNFRVWASPFSFNDTKFTICSVENIEDEKRREVLERIFFHDVNNILMAISGYTQMLAGLGGGAADTAEIIMSACKQLSEEIAAHDKLLSAENGKLAVNLSKIHPANLLKDAIDLFPMSVRGQKQILAGAIPDDFEVTTDRTLLLRIIRNMIKNALEASLENDRIHITFEYNDFSCVFCVHNSAPMPRSVQRQIFQRAFSTKGKGRGLGTYSMKLFGEKYLKGAVWFSSSKETGTDFFLSLPLVHPAYRPA
jgi:nitrogen-specific signal transduction histidine kinase